jgi:hypothetical protein
MKLTVPVDPQDEFVRLEEDTVDEVIEHLEAAMEAGLDATEHPDASDATEAAHSETKDAYRRLIETHPRYILTND